MNTRKKNWWQSIRWPAPIAVMLVMVLAATVHSEDKPRERKRDGAPREHRDQLEKGRRIDRDRMSNRGFDGRDFRNRMERMRPGHAKPWSEEEIEERLAVIRQFNPDLAEMIEQMRDANPDNLRARIGPHLRQIERMLLMKEQDSQLFELMVENTQLDRATREQARLLRSKAVQDDPEKAEQHRAALKEIVTAHFDVRQKMREHELAKLERRLEELRAAVGKRMEKRDELIEMRFKKALGESDQEQW